MQAFWEHPAGDQCLQDATLILPVASVGNVGQLAVDLVINTLRLGRVARLQDDALLPAVGSRPYAHVDGLATALEIYQQGEQQPGGSGRVAVAQQRSPAAPGTQAAFAERLAAFVKQSGVKEVLVLGSIEAQVRQDSQLAGPQLRCWAPSSSSSSSSSEAAAAVAGSALLERCRSSSSGGGGVPLLEGSFFEERALEARLLPPWPLLRELAAAGVPCAALLCFSAEGDNAADALAMAGAAAVAAGLSPAAAASSGGGEGEAAAAAAAVQWVPPPAWQYVYGASAAVY